MLFHFRFVGELIRHRTAYTTVPDDFTVDASGAGTETITATVFSVTDIPAPYKARRNDLSGEEEKWYQAAVEQGKFVHGKKIVSTLGRRHAAKDHSVVRALSSACTCLRIPESTRDVTARATPTVSGFSPSWRHFLINNRLPSSPPWTKRT